MGVVPCSQRAGYNEQHVAMGAVCPGVAEVLSEQQSHASSTAARPGPSATAAATNAARGSAAMGWDTPAVGAGAAAACGWCATTAAAGGSREGGLVAGAAAAAATASAATAACMAAVLPVTAATCF